MVPIPNSNGVPDMTNREIVTILLQEIADVRKELKEDARDLRHELKRDIADLSKKVDGIDRKLCSLEVKTDRNFICFMSSVETHEKRILVLEAK